MARLTKRYEKSGKVTLDAQIFGVKEGDGFVFGVFDKTAFLTPEAAQQALKAGESK